MAVSFARQAAWILRDKYEGKIFRLPIKDRQQLKNGCPLDYLIGWKPFLNCRIDLRFWPLIPRPETEFWAGQAVGEIKKTPNRVKVLDIFAGSGCVGLAILKNTFNTRVDFAEINSRFIRQIKLNLALNKMPVSRWRVIKSDVFQNITSRYDFILANPPYIPLKNKRRVVSSVRRHEPPQALWAGQEGLLYIKKFFGSLKKYLTPNGQAWLEFDSPQKNKIAALLKKEKFNRWKFCRDQFGRWRWVIIFNSSKNT